MAVPIQSKINTARREVAFCMRRYPLLVEQGKMTPAQADKEIRAMQAIVATLEALRQEKVA